VRVISGSARGRTILAPAGQTVRPTTDKTRQAVFNALASRNFVMDATVVDLFAGTGALGIEALSRGADRVTFIESDRLAIDCIGHNLDHLNFADQASVVRSDVLRWLDSASEKPFTVGDDSPLLVFADPPYTFTQWSDLLDRLHPRLLPLGIDAMVVLESGKTIELPHNWELEREQRYGSAYVTFARPKDPDAPADDIEGEIDSEADLHE
jgi:16S rRNA (guanine966-N2)-methyltransferase